MLNYSKRVLITTLTFIFVVITLQGESKKKPFKELEEWVRTSAPDITKVTKYTDLVEMQKKLQDQQAELASKRGRATTEVDSIVDTLKKAKVLDENQMKQLEDIIAKIKAGGELTAAERKFFEDSVKKLRGGDELLKRFTTETLPKLSVKGANLEAELKRQAEDIKKKMEEFGLLRKKLDTITEGAKKAKGKLVALGISGPFLISLISLISVGKLDEVLGSLFGLVFGDDIGKLIQEATHNFLSPNANPKAPEDDAEYHGTLQKVADLFTDIDKDFKNALTKCRYTDKKFKIYVGKVDAIEVFIEYDFEQDGAGDVGLPFTPFFVTLSPQQINGYAVTPDDLLGKMADGDAKDLTSYLLDPPASLIFMIKYIQLTNSALKSSAKDYSETMDYITDETIELFSRLNLSMEDVSPAVILKNMPEPVLDELSKRIRVYSYYVKKLDEPVEEQRTALVEKILELGTIKQFDAKLNFIDQQIIPDVKKNLYLDDKAIFTYLIEFIAAKLPDDLADDPDKIEKIKERCDKLLPIIEKSKTAMESAEFDQDQIQKMSALSRKVSSTKEDPTKFNINKPEFGDFKLEYQENGLDKALDVFYNIYQRINKKKIDVDNYYFDIDILNYGIRYTKYNLQVIFYNCLRYLNKAEAEIIQKEGALNLINFEGKEYTADTKSDLENMLKKPTETMKNARETVQSAIKGISTIIETIKSTKKIVENKDYKKAQEDFTKSINAAKEAIKSVSNARMKFRRTYAPYFAITMPNGTNKTTVQVLQSNIATLKNHSTYVDKLIPGVYTPFSKHLGLSERQLISINPPKEEVVRVQSTPKEEVVKTPAPEIPQIAPTQTVPEPIAAAV